MPVWTILRWLWIGGTDVWVLDDIGTALGQTIGLAAVAAVADHGAGLPRRVGRRAVQRCARPRRRRRQLRHQFAARHRHRPRARHRHHPPRPPALPERAR